MKRSMFCLVLCALLIWGSAQAAVCAHTDAGALLLEENGNEIVPLGVYEKIVALGGGRFAAEQDGMLLLLDECGNALTEALYSDLRRSGEWILACWNSLWGLLDQTGAQQSEFIYESLVSDGEGHFWALKAEGTRMDAKEVFMPDGSGGEIATGVLAERLGDEAGEGLIAVRLTDDKLWGYIDACGSIAIPAQYRHAGRFCGGRAAAVSEGAWGVIDAGGAWIVPAEYDALELSEAGFLAASRMGEGVWILDFNGELLAFHEGEECYAAVVGNAYSIYDGSELRLYDASCALLETLSRRGSVYAGLNGQWILSDGAWGEECVYLSGTETKWQNISPLGISEGTALYVCMRADSVRYVSELLGEIQIATDMESARYGVLNAEGELLIPCEYEAIEYAGSDRLLLYANGTWRLTDPQGEIYWSYTSTQSEEPNF